MARVFKRVAKRNTPWGYSQDAEEIKPGIELHSTAGHGGMYLHGFRLQAVREALPEFRCFGSESCGPWFEEDCDCCVVVLVFAHEFDADELRSAVKITRSCARHSDKWYSVARWLDSTFSGQRILSRIAQWERENAHK
jgi:hypothetical protein